ncbi:MAG: hypothetical protein GX580_08015 [Candidatus Hydrogenedens sp.]|nr:hypothetical protein [Candidatus Hydrogenedentota bacterium]NLF57568.1 hypothetical protein [Candidatus Hydrogenedens sp.]
MSDLNMQLVREFFELNRFYVLPHWRHDELSKSPENTSLLFVEQPRPDPAVTPGFLLQPGEVASLRRAVVEVRAWHADRFYPSVIESSPILGRVASPEIRDLAAGVFDADDFSTVLVVSEFAASPRPRARALELLQTLGINHVIEFSMMLGDLLNRVSTQGNYAPSQTLQTMRLLKRYQFIRRQQLEMIFTGPPAEYPPRTAPHRPGDDDD